MPFQYTPYQSPYVGSIAELIGKRGDIAAQQAQNKANLIGNITNAVTRSIGDIAQYQREKPARELAALQLAEAKRQDEAARMLPEAQRFFAQNVLGGLTNQSIDAAATKPSIFTMDERGMPQYNPALDKGVTPTAPQSQFFTTQNGQTKIDVPKAYAAMSAKYGAVADKFIPLMNEMQAHLDTAATANRQLLTKMSDLFLQSGGDPAMGEQLVGLAHSVGLVPQASADAAMDALRSGNTDMLTGWARTLGTPAKMEVVPEGSSVYAIDAAGARTLTTGISKPTTIDGSFDVPGMGSGIKLERKGGKLYPIGRETPLTPEQVQGLTLTRPEGSEESQINNLEARLLEKDPTLTSHDIARVIAYRNTKDRESALIGGRQAAAAERSALIQKQQIGLNRLDNADKDSNEKLQSVAAVEDVINAAQSGNKIAQVTTPMLVAFGLGNMEGMHRFNKAEFEMIGGAGSMWDKIRGGISGLTAGQPIPPDVLKNMQQFVQIMKERVTQEHAARRQQIKRTFDLPDLDENVPNLGEADFVFDPNSQTLTNTRGQNRFGTPTIRIKK